MLGVCADAAKALDESTPKTQVEIKSLSHQAQGLSLGYQF